MHYYAHGANGSFVLRHPLVLGHESCGIITSLPNPLPPNCPLKVGDRVAPEVGLPCRVCPHCTEGRYNLCPTLRFKSSAKTHPHLDGTLVEYMNHPLSLLHKLPEGMPLELAALAEPLAVVLHAWHRGNLRSGSKILVLGAGAVGLLACAVASAFGCVEVIAADIEPAKLQFAQDRGWVTGTYTLPRGPRVSGKDALETAKENWEAMSQSELVKGKGLGDGFDAVVECTGVEGCMQLAVLSARTGGKAVFVGMGTQELLLPVGQSLIREVDLVGVFRYANTYPEALALLGSGKLGDVGKMITQRYPLEEAGKAFEALKNGRDEEGRYVIKAMVGSVPE